MKVIRGCGGRSCGHGDTRHFSNSWTVVRSVETRKGRHNSILFVSIHAESQLNYRTAVALMLCPSKKTKEEQWQHNNDRRAWQHSNDRRAIFWDTRKVFAYLPPAQRMT